jgi:hypothetical protein
VVFERPSYLTSNIRWKRRRFCTKSCADAAKTRTGVKVCERCGTEFRREDLPYNIDDKNWEARRLCGEECRRANLSEIASARIGDKSPVWKGDAATNASGNRRARVLVPVLGSCARCGEQAEVRHHIDENPRNNVLENIEQLCRDCHLKHHNPVRVRWRKHRQG